MTLEERHAQLCEKMIAEDLTEAEWSEMAVIESLLLGQWRNDERRGLLAEGR